MAIHSSILACESHAQRSLAGYSLWGHKEWDTAESLTLSLSSTRTCHEVHVRTLQPHSWTCIPQKSPHRTKEDTCMDYASGHCLWQWEVWRVGMVNVVGTLQNFRRPWDLMHPWHHGQTLKSEVLGENKERSLQHNTMDVNEKYPKKHCV